MLKTAALPNYLRLLSSLLVLTLCTCDRAPEPLFKLRKDTGITFTNTLHETGEFNIVEYLYYYNGGGVAATDINGNGLPDIYVCNVSGYKGLTGRNELFLQAEDGTFTEAAADYGLDFSGFNTQAYWFDYDLDGDLDMYLLRHSVHNDATYGTAAGREVPDSLAGDLLLRNDLNAEAPAPRGSPIKGQNSRFKIQDSFTDVT